MLPDYHFTLTRERLTDDIVNAALDNNDLARISTEAARDAVYEYLSHDAVFDETLDVFREEFAPDAKRGEDIPELMSAIEALAIDCRRDILNEEIAAYRDAYVHELDVRAAMRTAGITGEVSLMQNLVASYAVLGPDIFPWDYDSRTEMEAGQFSIDNVKAVFTNVKND